MDRVRHGEAAAGMSRFLTRRLMQSAVLLLLVLVVPIVFYQNFQQRQLEADR